MIGLQPASCHTRVADATFLSEACPATVSEAACSSKVVSEEAEFNFVDISKPITDANSELQLTVCHIHEANADPSVELFQWLCHQNPMQTWR